MSALEIIYDIFLWNLEKANIKLHRKSQFFFFVVAVVNETRLNFKSEIKLFQRFSHRKLKQRFI